MPRDAGDAGLPDSTTCKRQRKGLSLRYGVTFPHSIGTDPSAIRDYAQAVEGAGFDYMLTFDHVAGAHPDHFGPSGPPFNFTHETPTHEMFVLFGYFAGVTIRLEFVTSVLLLAQRQTVLAAKQAAEMSILSGGRLRLAVGVGWNHAEYASLGQNFHTRGQRLEEQLIVLKKLWTEPLVTFEGRWHHLDRVAINPRPARPPAIWIGGGAEDRTLRRAARLADGWMPLVTPSVDVADALARLRGFLKEEGRNESGFGLDVRVNVGSGGAADWVAAARRWQSLGATHMAINSPPAGRKPLEVLEAVSEARKIIAGELR